MYLCTQSRPSMFNLFGLLCVTHSESLSPIGSPCEGAEVFPSEAVKRDQSWFPHLHSNVLSWKTGCHSPSQHHIIDSFASLFPYQFGSLLIRFVLLAPDTSSLHELTLYLQPLHSSHDPTETGYETKHQHHTRQSIRPRDSHQGQTQHKHGQDAPVVCTWSRRAKVLDN